MVKSVKSRIFLGQIPTFFQFWAGKSHHFWQISQDLYREIHRFWREFRRYTVAFADRNAAAKSKAEISFQGIEILNDSWIMQLHNVTKLLI